MSEASLSPRRDSGARDLAVVAAVAALAAFWQIGAKAIWLDEAVSWDFTLRTPADLTAKTAADIHPPLYYLLLSGWTRLAGDSLAGLRSLSAVATIGSALLVCLLGRRWLPRTAAMSAAIAYAASPHTIYFAQEARMYSLAAFFVLGAALAERRWIDSRCTRTADLVVYALAAACAMYTHYATALALFAITVHLVAACRPPVRALTRWLAANIFAALLYVPWMPIAAAQIFRGQPWRQEVTLADLPGHFVEAVFQLQFGLYQFPHMRLWPHAFVVALVAVGLVGMLTILRRPDRDGREADWLLVVMVTVPLVLALFAQLRSGYLSLPRYLTYLLPFLVLLLARGYAVLLRPAAATAALVVLAALHLPTLGHYYAQPTRDYDPAPVVAFLQERIAESGDWSRDRIIFAPGYMHLVFRYYWRDLRHESVSRPADLDELLRQPAPRRVWVVEDYRWVHGHGGVARPDLEHVPVPGADERRVRVWRKR